MAAKPVYTWPAPGRGRGNVVTVAGAADRPGEDSVERGAVLKGRVRIDEGKRVCVVGVLEVRSHGPGVVGATEFPGWTEVRVEN